VTLWFLLASSAERGDALVGKMAQLASGRNAGLVNRTDGVGNNALYYAVVAGKPELAAWLLAQPDFSLGKSAQQASEWLARLEQDIFYSASWNEARQALALVAEAVRRAWPEDESEQGAPPALVPDRVRKAKPAQTVRKPAPRSETDPKEREAEWFRLARGKDGGKDVRRRMSRLLEIEPGLIGRVDGSGLDALHYLGKTGKRQLERWLSDMQALSDATAARTLGLQSVADSLGFDWDVEEVFHFDAAKRNALANLLFPSVKDRPPLTGSVTFVQTASKDKRDQGKPSTAENRIEEAYRENDAATLRRLLRTPEGKNWALTATSPHGTNLLIYAAINGKLSMVEALLEVNDGELARQSPNGPSALLMAASAGHLDVLKVLLRHDRNSAVTHVTPDGLNVFLIAATSGMNHCVKYLLSWSGGRLAASVSKNNDTALILAARTGHENVVRTMIDHGDPDILDLHNLDNANALTEAAGNGHAGIARLLLQARGSLAWSANYDMSPLLLAAQRGHTDVVRAFLESADGVLLSRCVVLTRNFNALDLAEQNGHEETAKVLREFNGGSMIRKPRQ
jgi:ankyrin repeat protein